jgi:hypothetical protein
MPRTIISFGPFKTTGDVDHSVFVFCHGCIVPKVLPVSSTKYFYFKPLQNTGKTSILRFFPDFWIFRLKVVYYIKDLLLILVKNQVIHSRIDGGTN